jgi:hypothetical protein
MDETEIQALRAALREARETILTLEARERAALEKLRLLEIEHESLQVAFHSLDHQEVSIRTACKLNEAVIERLQSEIASLKNALKRHEDHPYTDEC